MAEKPEPSENDDVWKEVGRKERSWTTARGKRELHEIVIETYENEDPMVIYPFVFSDHELN